MEQQYTLIFAAGLILRVPVDNKTVAGCAQSTHNHPDDKLPETTEDSLR
jgi:hypothetical protein